MNNTQTDDAQYNDAVTPMYNLIKSIDNYSVTSRTLWQYFRDVSMEIIMVQFLILLKLILLLIRLILK